jgi:hypothetical protein
MSSSTNIYQESIQVILSQLMLLPPQDPSVLEMIRFILLEVVCFVMFSGGV